MTRRPTLLALAFALSLTPFASWSARAQEPKSVTPSQLLAQGFVLAAASSNAQTQYIYLQGVDASGKKMIYACQLTFGYNGGFQGCLALP